MMPLDYLIIAPHPDDAELGVGGTIALLLSQGRRVGVLDLTNGEPTPFGSPEIRQKETEAATAVLGLTWRNNLGLVNRRLESDLPSRALLAGVLRQTRPRVPVRAVLGRFPSRPRRRQRAGRCGALLGQADEDRPARRTALPQTHFLLLQHPPAHPSAPSLVVDVSDHLETKMRAVSCYRSQLIEGRPASPPTVLDDVRDRARYWGWAIGTAHGEPFLCREELGVRRLDDLV